MSQDEQRDEDMEPARAGLLDGPLDYEVLKSEIQDKGPLRQLHPDTGLQHWINITPCQCAVVGCTNDVISVVTQHGVVSFRSSIDKDALMAHSTLKEFFHAFFHYPEAFYSSSGDEQAIEMEAFSKLGVDPFAIYEAEDVHEEISRQFKDLGAVEADFWQAHNLLPLIRVLYFKRRAAKWAREEVDQFEGAVVEKVVKDTFDLGFLAGRLWSEYRTKDNHEDSIKKGEASIRAQAVRTKGSSAKATEKKNANLELVLAQIEAMSRLVGVISKDRILAQAFENAAEQNPGFPSSKKTHESYEDVLSSEEPFKSRYWAVFAKKA